MNGGMGGLSDMDVVGVVVWSVSKTVGKYDRTRMEEAKDGLKPMKQNQQ